MHTIQRRRNQIECGELDIIRNLDKEKKRIMDIIMSNFAKMWEGSSPLAPSPRF